MRTLATEFYQQALINNRSFWTNKTSISLINSTKQAKTFSMQRSSCLIAVHHRIISYHHSHYSVTTVSLTMTVAIQALTRDFVSIQILEVRCLGHPSKEEWISSSLLKMMTLVMCHITKELRRIQNLRITTKNFWTWKIIQSSAITWWISVATH